MKKLFKNLVLLGIFLIYANNIFAVENERKIAGYDTVYVRANKYPVSIYKIPQAASIFESKEIKSSSANTVAQFLSSKESLFLYDMNGSGVNPVVEIRGFMSAGKTSYMKVMINGMTLNELDTDGIDWNILNMQQIERIEVFRGPASVLYGNSSMSGIINIVTKDDFFGLGGNLSLFGGSNKNKGLELNTNFGYDKFIADLSFKLHQIDGWRENSEWDNKQIFGNFIYNIFEKTKFNLTLLFNDTKKNEPGAIMENQDYKDAGTPNDYSNNKKFQLGFSINQKFNNNSFLEFKNNINLNDSKCHETVYMQPLKHNYDTFNYEGELKYYKKGIIMNHESSLLAGLEFSTGTLNGKYLTTDTISMNVTDSETKKMGFGAYLKTENNLTNSLSFIAGGRYDYLNFDYESKFTGIKDDNSMNALTFSAGINYKLSHFDNIYMSISKSFKAPTLLQVYDDRPFFVAPTIPPISISNNELKPQHAYNYEIGFRKNYKDLIFTDLAIYYLNIKDEIGFDAANFKYANIEKSIHTGLELKINFNLGKGIKSGINYNYTKAVFDGGEFDKNQINGVPKNKLNINLGYESTLGLFSEIELQYIGKSYIDEANEHSIKGYNKVNLKAGYKYNNATIELAVNNLFDKKYFASGYYAAPLPAMYYPGEKLNIFGKISYSF